MNGKIKASIAIMILCLLVAWGCNEEENIPTDEGHVADVNQETDTTVGTDTAVGTDTNQGDTAVGTDTNQADTDVGTDTAIETDTTGDEDVGDPPDVTTPDALTNTFTLDECPVAGNKMLPWVTEFDIGGDMSANGWEIIQPQTIAGGMWDLPISSYDFGTLGGRYAMFMGEEGLISRTGLYSDCVDTTLCAASGTVTLQWRMSYQHADPAKSVTLKLVAIHGTDLDAGEVIWTATVTEDIAYNLYSVELPAALVGTNGIRIALVLEFPDESALATEKWSIDHFVMACGKPNVNVKTLIYACPEGDAECTLATATQVGEAFPAGTPASMTIDVCDKALLVLCGFDQDAGPSTWQVFGFPGILRDPPPSIRGGTMAPALAVASKNGCETLPQQVALVCGTPAAETQGYFYCAAEFSVDCNQDYRYTWEMAAIIRDELDTTGIAPLHSPLESRLPITVEAINAPE